MKSKIVRNATHCKILRPITTSQVFLFSDERLRNLRLYYFNVIINTIACPKETNETTKPVIIWLINSYLSNWLIFNNLENIKMLYQPATDLGCPKHSWYFVRWTKYRPGISKMLQLFIIIPIVHWNIAFLKLFLLWDRRKGWWSVFPWKHSVWYVCINYLQNHIIKRLLLAFFLLIHSIDLKNRSNTCILLYRWYPTF